jgi:uncharacterized protein YndB with AHSA1/START domain
VFLMPKVSRKRLVAAPVERVWGLVSDPHSLPRWWPKTTRVEDVREESGKTEWTSVFGTEKGNAVRADYRCTASEEPRRYGWEQEIEGSPFERVLKSAAVGIELVPDDGGTVVTVTANETLRGMSRLGSPMMRGAAGDRLEDALDGIERALT